MSKDQTVKGKSNYFSLTRVTPECHYEQVFLDFDPTFKQIMCQCSLGKASNSIVPAFCRDSKHFTPGFILPREKEYYDKNQGFEKACFQDQVHKAQNLMESLNKDQSAPEQLNLAVPSVNFCQICKITFTSYFEHLKQNSHQTKSQNSPANAYIKELCKHYIIIRKTHSQKTKTKPINKVLNKIIESLPIKKQTRSRKKQTQLKNTNMSTCVPNFTPVSN